MQLRPRLFTIVLLQGQYPYRPVQIVLRLYRSPAEVLAGFDVDAPCAAFDGTRVWANPRAITAWMTQCNTVDMSRRSPSYVPLGRQNTTIWILICALDFQLRSTAG